MKIRMVSLACVLLASASTSLHAQDTQPSAARARDRADWMHTARWGVMTHYLADWRAQVDKEPASVEHWNDLIDHFDVEGLAQQLEAVGAGWYQITIGQNSGYYLAPNATYDKLTGVTPSKCSKRDLISDLYEPLHKRGIRLMVYLPSAAPGGDRVAREKLQWNTVSPRNREFQLKWEQVIADWSTRFGTKVSGWWFDGCYTPNAMYRWPDHPNFESFAMATRTGNPDAAVGFNPGVIGRLIAMSPYDDYTAGEANAPDRTDVKRAANGKVDGAVPHMLTYLGTTWGKGEPRYTNEQVLDWSRKITSQQGVITYDVPIQKTGLIAQPFIDQLAAVGKMMNEPARAAE